MARTSTKPRAGSPLHLPGAFELWRPSKEIVLKNIWIFGPLFAVQLIFGIHDWIWAPGPGQTTHWWNHASGFGAGWPGSPFPAYNSAIFVGFSILWLLFVLIVGGVVAIMNQRAQLDAVENKPLDFQDLWKVVKDRWRDMILLYIAVFVVVVVGLFLLIIPGLIFLRRYFLASYVMLDGPKGMGVGNAMKRSAELTKLNTGSIWGIFGVMLLIGLVGIIPFVGPLISFIIGALYSIAPALRYQQLKKINA